MLDYNLEKRGEASLYEYVYQQIRDDIVAGRIVAGEHLPSKRAFASHLGISVITIENAYSQLLAEGLYLLNAASWLLRLQASGCTGFAFGFAGHRPRYRLCGPQRA